MTNTIVASPNVKGNIGSCTTQIATVYTTRGFWTTDVDQIATNSCTGQVTHYPTWEITGIGGGVIFFTIFILILIGMVVASPD